MPLDKRTPLLCIDLASHATIDLGGALLEPSTLTLQGCDRQAMLEPRVMRVLVALAGATGAVLSRDTLLETCWGGLVVGDDALHRAVAGARRALREAGATNCAIETIPRVGYRLVSMAGPVAAEHVTAKAAPDDTIDRSSSLPLVGPTGPTAPDFGQRLVAPGRMASSTLSSPRRRLLLVGALAASGAVAALGWKLSRPEPVPPAVAGLLMQGRDALRLGLPGAAREAAGFYEQAARLSPRYAPAWGQLALARRQMAEAANPVDLPELLSSVENSAARALALDATQPDALTARALMVPAFGQWERVERQLQAVLDRYPDHLPALDAMALLMSSTGVVAAHYPLRLKTVTLDPLHAGYNFRSIYSHWMNQQVAAADLAGERGVELWPRHLPTWLARLSLFKYTGRAARALKILDDKATRPDLPPAFEALLRATTVALVSGAAADRAAARALVVDSLGTNGPLAAVGATMDLAALGETALALDVTEAYLLERGPLTAGTTWRPGQTQHDDVRRRFTNHLFLPVTAPLRADPRFAEITRDIGLGAQWARPNRRPDYLGEPPLGSATGSRT